ncbi:MAG TPA: YfiR family protein [Nannocystaceae bacterium]|nr:YfiR family protein [Nannocystaceae bacterium]
MSALPRRRVLPLLVGLGLLPWWTRRASAATSPDVPIETQVKLLDKVIGYDRNAETRMAGTCRVLVLERKNDSESASAAAKLRTDLHELGELAGAAVELRSHVFDDVAGVVKKCTDQKIAVLAITPGLSNYVAAIADRLDGGDLITLSLLAHDVHNGAVLGFALESSRPTIWINLGRAKRQNVDFSSRLLALAKVVG